MAGNAPQRRLGSGVRAIHLFDVIVERRKRIADIGYEDGRWSYELTLAAYELALCDDIPTDDAYWCAFLDELSHAARVAVSRTCRIVYDRSTDVG